MSFGGMLKHMAQYHVDTDPIIFYLKLVVETFFNKQRRVRERDFDYLINVDKETALVVKKVDIIAVRRNYLITMGNLKHIVRMRTRPELEYIKEDDNLNHLYQLI